MTKTERSHQEKTNKDGVVRVRDDIHGYWHLSDTGPHLVSVDLWNRYCGVRDQMSKLTSEMYDSPTVFSYPECQECAR